MVSFIKSIKKKWRIIKMNNASIVAFICTSFIFLGMILGICGIIGEAKRWLSFELLYIGAGCSFIAGSIGLFLAVVAMLIRYIFVG
jgi:ABC-type polysaccharide/polyol phosphate export permease